MFYAQTKEYKKILSLKKTRRENVLIVNFLRRTEKITEY